MKDGGSIQRGIALVFVFIDKDFDLYSRSESCQI